ncbi:MAG TPA: DinB family protein [Terriglobia bacterium]|nr:DinB family protein [Terriglobia bacterium]
MELLRYFQRLFEYDAWGNREALASLGSVASGAERPLKFLGHIIGAQRIWLARLEHKDPFAFQPWPALSLDECRAALDELSQRWKKFLQDLTSEQLSQEVIYRNTQGTEFRTPLVDVLEHLVMHSAYHRGQLAAAIREAGGKPAPTDYVVYVRQLPQRP